MKKLFSFGLAAIFSLAILASACSKDEEKCVTCTDGDTEYKVCWDEGKLADKTLELAEFYSDHPTGDCEE